MSFEDFAHFFDGEGVPGPVARAFTADLASSPQRSSERIRIPQSSQSNLNDEEEAGLRKIR
jgi:hypothetical protein